MENTIVRKCNINSKSFLYHYCSKSKIEFVENPNHMYLGYGYIESLNEIDLNKFVQHPNYFHFWYDKSLAKNQ